MAIQALAVATLQILGATLEVVEAATQAQATPAALPLRKVVGIPAALPLRKVVDIPAVLHPHKEATPVLGLLLVADTVLHHMANPRDQCYKTFYVCNLRMFVIS